MSTTLLIMLRPGVPLHHFRRRLIVNASPTPLSFALSKVKANGESSADFNKFLDSTRLADLTGLFRKVDLDNEEANYLSDEDFAATMVAKDIEENDENKTYGFKSIKKLFNNRLLRLLKDTAKRLRYVLTKLALRKDDNWQNHQEQESKSIFMHHLISTYKRVLDINIGTDKAVSKYLEKWLANTPDVPTAAAAAVEEVQKMATPC